MSDKLLLTEHPAGPGIARPNGSGKVTARSGLLGASDSSTCSALLSPPSVPSPLHKKVSELALTSWASGCLL